MKQSQAYNEYENDIFSYLKTVMYDESIAELRRTGKEIHAGVFYETIRMLEGVEFGLAKIKNNLISTQAAYLDADVDAKRKIICFLNYLRLDKELIELATLVDSWFSVQVNLFIGLVENEFSEFYDDGHDWSPHNLPVDRVFECIAKYRETYNLRQKEIFEERTSCNKRHIEFATVFNKIVWREKKVYVLNLVVKINLVTRQYLPITQWRQDDVEHVMQALRSSYQVFGQQFNVLVDYVNTYLGTNESFNFHLVLVLKNDREHNDDQIAIEFWNLLNQNLNQQGYNFIVTVDSLNEVIKRQFNSRDVTGLLGYRPKKQLEDFNYWFLYLFAHTQRFVRAMRHSVQHTPFDIHDVGYKISRLFHEVRHPERKPRTKKAVELVKLSALYREFNGEGIWETATRKLKDKNTYTELCRISDEQKHFFVFKKDTSERMAQLELFIAHLEHADISPISEDVPLEYIVHAPKQYLLLIEKMAIILLLDHSLSHTYTEYLSETLQGTLSSGLAFFCHEHSKSRDVIKVPDNSDNFSLGFYRELHQYLYNLRCKLHESLKVKVGQDDIAAKKAQQMAKVRKNFDSITKYVRYYFRHNMDVYRFKMTCHVDTGHVPEALLCLALSEIWTEFLKDIKRKPKVIGKQLVAHVGTYISLTPPLIDVTLIFDATNQGGFQNNLVENINRHWKNYLTDEVKKQISHKLAKRQKDGKLLKDSAAIDYIDFLNKISLQSKQLPLIGEKRRGQNQALSCNYKDKKQRSAFIKILAGYYAYYGLLGRTPIEGCATDLNLLLKGRMPSSKQDSAIPAKIVKSDFVSEQPVSDKNETIDNVVNQEVDYSTDHDVLIAESISSLDDQIILEQNQAETESEDQPETILHTQNIEHLSPSDPLDQVAIVELVENHVDQTRENTMKSVNIEIRSKLVGVQPIINKPKGS